MRNWKTAQKKMKRKREREREKGGATQQAEIGKKSRGRR